MSSEEALQEAKERIEELTAILKKIQQEPLILMSIDRLSQDKRYAFISRGEQILRIEAVPNLEKGDEVLVHPQSHQIVERIGKPPLKLSPFAPETLPNVTWDDIGGLEEAKADLIEAIETPHKHKALFKFYNKRQIKGVLLSGPPGCGKTLLGKAAANAISQIYGKKSARTGFLYVKGPEVLNQYVGASERTIRELFADARRHKKEHGYPAIIFLDEADALLGARGSRITGGLQATIVPQFLTEMDGLEESSAIIMLATNRPDVLDPAIVRDGRIDRKVTVSRPGPKEGRTILEMSLKKTPLVGEEPSTLAEKLAQEVWDHQRQVRGRPLAGIVSGAMLVNIVDIASSLAMRRDIDENKKTGLTFADGLSAIDRIQSQSLHNSFGEAA